MKQDKSRTALDNRQDSEQDSEDLAAAAVRLGLTVETVRKRLQRGKIKGFKRPDGTWRVTLDRVDNEQDSPGQPAGQEQDKLAQARDDLVDQLRSENAFLRNQLQARDEEIRRVHVLLQGEQQQVRALTAQRERARPWWQFWK
jgi:hypothetical protein